MVDLPIKVTLEKPIEIDGKVISEIYFDEIDLGTQIGYADLEEELGLAELRKTKEGVESRDFLEKLPTPKRLRLTEFWIESLGQLPKGAARKLKFCDMDHVMNAIDAVLSNDNPPSDAGGEPGK